jgi:hypothetical protein
MGEVESDEVGAEGGNCFLKDLEPGFCAKGKEFAFVWDSLYNQK